MPSRRVFLGWTGLTGYGVWALLKPPPQAHKPKPTTTTSSTTTTTVAPTTTTTSTGGVYADIYADTY